VLEFGASRVGYAEQELQYATAPAAALPEGPETTKAIFGLELDHPIKAYIKRLEALAA